MTIGVVRVRQKELKGGLHWDVVTMGHDRGPWYLLNNGFYGTLKDGGTKVNKV